MPYSILYILLHMKIYVTLCNKTKPTNRSLRFQKKKLVAIVPKYTYKIYVPYVLYCMYMLCTHNLTFNSIFCIQKF